MPRVMLVGLAESEAKRLAKIYQKVNVACEVLSSIDTALDRIAADPPALVVAERPDRLEALHGLHSVLKTRAPATPYLVTMDRHDVPTALEGLRAGAYDCLSRPYKELDILAASKRATWRQGRMLFTAKVREKKKPVRAIVLGMMLGVLVFLYGKRESMGPPPNNVMLGSAHLAGLQWEGRSLWVGDWFESTVTRYEVPVGFMKKARLPVAKDLFRMADGQPILMCNTPDALVTVGSDLRLRRHQRVLGLPTVQTSDAPGPLPTGLAWDGERLWTCDAQTGLLYRLGGDLRVLEAVKSLFSRPVGLAWYEDALWVMGEEPLRLARMRLVGSRYVWDGPFPVKPMFVEGMVPSGMAIGFGRLWMVSGGDPQMVSLPLDEIISSVEGWTRPKKKGEKRGN